MPEPLSRVLLAIEALVILLPTTLLALYGSIFFIGAGIGEGILHIHRMPLLLDFAALAALFVLWCLAFRFVRGGTRTLRASSRTQWATVGMGAVLALLGLVVVWADPFVPGSTTLGEWGVGLLSFGSPALIPLAHLVIEARVREHVR